RLALQTLPPHVAHDAHDRVPRAIGIARAQLESPAHGIGPGPRPPCHRLVDDRDRWGPRTVHDRKDAAAEQRRPDGFEEIRADLITSQSHPFGHRSIVPFGGDDLIPAVCDEQIADDPGVFDSWYRVNLVEHVLIEGGSLHRAAER